MFAIAPFIDVATPAELEPFLFSCLPFRIQGSYEALVDKRVAVARQGPLLNKGAKRKEAGRAPTQPSPI